MENTDYHILGHTIMRIVLGALFFVMGIKKFINPEGITGMLDGIGFPAATLFAWILILAEVVFGALILVGYKVKYTAWPLVIILGVALITVTIPNDGFSSANFYFHLLSITALISISWVGPGKWALKKAN